MADQPANSGFEGKDGVGFPGLPSCLTYPGLCVKRSWQLEKPMGVDKTSQEKCASPGKDWKGATT